MPCRSQGAFSNRESERDRHVVVGLNIQAATSTERLGLASVPTSLVSRRLNALLPQATSQSALHAYRQNDCHRHVSSVTFRNRFLLNGLTPYKCKRNLNFLLTATVHATSYCVCIFTRNAELESLNNEIAQLKLKLASKPVPCKSIN